MAEAILAESLTRIYGRTRGGPTRPALDHLDLAVPRGTVHGLLGPNGAGKTTLVRILATLLHPTAGRAVVAGHDVVREADLVRSRIGLVGQHAALDPELSGRENLDLIGRLRHLGGRGAARRAAELLAHFDLTEAADRPVRHYSGGMRRRLDLAASLVTRPEVLFLDEPTTGLDPRSRAEVWSSVRSLAGGGTTVLLTTQYLEEADQLADRVSVVDAGRLVADGTPEELKARAGADHVDVVVRDARQLPAAAALLARATGAGPARTSTDPDRRLASAPVTDRMAALARTVTALADAGLDAEDVALRRPTLDEVFLHLTGDGPAAHDRQDPARGKEPQP